MYWSKFIVQPEAQESSAKTIHSTEKQGLCASPIYLHPPNPPRFLDPRWRNVAITSKLNKHQNLNLSLQSITFEVEVIRSATMKEKKTKDTQEF